MWQASHGSRPDPSRGQLRGFHGHTQEERRAARIARAGLRRVDAADGSAAPDPAHRAGRTAGRLSETGHGPVERVAGPGRGAGHQRPAFRRAGVALQPGGELHHAALSAQWKDAAADGLGGRGRRQDQGAHPLRGAAARRRGLAEQLPRAQPRGAQARAGQQRRDAVARPAEPVGRCAARPCVANRRERVRGRQERRHHGRPCSVRERALPADRVRAADRRGQGAPAADGAALHQQVLHPRPAARQLADPLRGGRGQPGVRRQLAQPGRVGQALELGRLHRAGRAGGHPRGAGDLGPGPDQHAGLLRRRHHPRHRAGGAGRAR
mmetsp:Transcript_14080/g.38479  ORF Transcript_14080/g.38479 Transcript_14080/m.38479 type:complete len:323 (-) Transcript_14080:1718-2686(-)